MAVTIAQAARVCYATLKHWLHHIVLKIINLTSFFCLTAFVGQAYYARQVGKSGQKWAFQSSLWSFIKVSL